MNGEHNQRQPHAIQWGAPRPGGAEPAWQGPSPDAPAATAPESTPPQGATPSGLGAQGSWGYAPEASRSDERSLPQEAARDHHRDDSRHGDEAASAPLGNPWGFGQNQGSSGSADRSFAPDAPSAPASAPGWAGTAGSGSTAEEISNSHPDNAGYGWSDGSGSSRFDAPDRSDHAPRSNEPYAAPASSDAYGAESRRVDAPARPESAPSYESAPPQQDARSYDSAPPQQSREAGNTDGSRADHVEPSSSAGPASYASAPNLGQTGADSAASSAAAPQEYESNPPQVVGQNDDLPDDSLTIGRSRSNSIVLDDMLVSRRHVVITADEEGLLLRDLGSRNGTFVNGRRVEQTHLHEGDRIGIGASTFEVRDGWLVSV